MLQKRSSSKLVSLLAAVLMSALPVTGSPPQGRRTTEKALVRITRIIGGGRVVEAEIDAGTDDGVVEGWQGRLFSKWNSATKRDHKELGTVEVLSAKERTATVRLTVDNPSGATAPIAGDLAELPLRLPAEPKRSLLWELAKLDITMTDGFRKPLFTFRTLVNSETEAADEAVFQRILSDIIGTAKELGSDSALLKEPQKAGRYRGRTLYDVMTSVKRSDVEAFFQFVASYPGKYIGGTWRVDETFATWVINGAPTSHLELRAQLTPASKEERAKILTENRAVIVKDGMMEYWHVAAQNASIAGRHEEAHRIADFALQCAETFGLQEAAAWVWFSRGYILSNQSRPKESIEAYKTAVRLFRSVPKPTDETRRGIAFSLNNLGGEEFSLGLYKQARATYTEALKLKENSSRLFADSRGLTLLAIGNTDRMLGNYPSALKMLDEAVLELTRAANTRRLNDAQQKRAQVLGRLGRTGDALQAYDAILKIQTRERDLEGQANTHIARSDFLWRLGRYTEALQGYTEAARIRAALDDTKGLVEAVQGIARLELNLGHYEAAVGAHRRAELLAKSLNDTGLQARVLKEIGDLYSRTGDYPNAILSYQQAKRLFAEAGNRAGEASAQEETALVHSHRKAFRESLEAYEAALVLYQATGAKAAIARTLYNRGLMQSNLGNIDAAIASYGAAREIQREIKARADEIDTMVSIAGLKWSRGDRAGAEALHAEALKLVVETGNRAQEADLRRQYGALLMQRFDMTGARRNFDQALAVHRDAKTRNRQKEAQLLSAIGSLLYAQARYVEAQRMQDQALAIATEIKSRPEMVNALRELGWIYRTLGDQSRALEMQHRSLSMAREVNDPIAVADSLYALAAVHVAFADNVKALDALNQALAIYTEQKHEFGRMVTFNALGVLFYQQGDFVESRSRFTESRDLSIKLNAKTDQYYADLNLGELNLQTGRTAEGLALLNSALALATKLQDPSRITSVELLKSKGYRQRAAGAKSASASADLRLAAATSSRAVNRCRPLSVPGLLSDALLETARVSLALGRIPEAAKSLSEAARVAEKVKARHVLWEIYDTQSDLWVRAKNLRAAVDAKRRAIAVVEEMKQGVAGGDKAVATFLQSKVRLYESMAELLAKQSAQEKRQEERRRIADEALKYVQLARFQVLSKAAGSSAPTGDQQFDNAGQGYREAVLRQGQLEREKADAVNSGNLAKAQAVEAIMARNEEEMAGSYVKLNQADPDFAARLKFDPRRITDNVANLPEKTALVVYFPGTDGLHIWVFDRNGFKVWRTVKVDRTELYNLVGAFRMGIDQMKGRVAKREKLGTGFGPKAEADPANPEWYRRNILEMRQTLTRLHTLLISPAAKELSEADTLLLLPYGRLCYLPFEALVAETPAGPRFLAQQKRIVCFTSEPHLQSVLRDLDRPAQTGADTWVAFADPRGQLGSAMEEAQEIAALFSNAEIHSKAKGRATKDGVYTLRPDCTILHFATHGWLNSSNPNQTFLEMGLPDGGPKSMEVKLESGEVKVENDGALTQLEIYPRLRKLVPSFRKRQVKLVTLSACDTARGQESPEAEVLGMPDAFTMAGAGAVLASQWPVETYTTTDLMIDFYRKYAKEHRPKAEALAAAKRALIENDGGKTAHPFYWAPFVLFGDWR
jgi:CHAT domain-containing protein/tetratricopeptide (TPR) repeat protein